MTQGEEMLIAPGASEGFGNVVFGLFAVDVAMQRELFRIALTGENIADDGEASDTRDIFEDESKLQIHL